MIPWRLEHHTEHNNNFTRDLLCPWTDHTKNSIEVWLLQVDYKVNKTGRKKSVYRLAFNSALIKKAAKHKKNHNLPIKSVLGQKEVQN